MTIKQICGAVAFAAVLSVSVAQAADAPAAPAANAPATATATEKCDVTKDGKTMTADVAVGTCVKNGGKLATDSTTATPVAPAAGAAMAPAKP